MMGRALLGAGAAAALLAAMKAIVTWFPRERLGLVIGGLITVAGIGALVMADPAALIVQAYGWRALFMLLAAVAVLCAILTVLLVPTSATVIDDVPDEDRGLPFVLRDPIFRRFAPLAAIAVGTVWAIQGQWIAGWLATVSGVRLTAIITYITLIAVGQAAGALVWGALADWAARMGLSAAKVFAGAVALGVCIQLAAVGGIGLPSSIVWGALVSGAATMLPFVVLLAHFPQVYAARACASVGLLQYVATFFIQSGRRWRRRIRSNVSDRLCDGIHGADRITTRCSRLVVVSSIENTGRRAGRWRSRCVRASDAGRLGTAAHSRRPATRYRCDAGQLSRGARRHPGRADHHRIAINQERPARQNRTLLRRPTQREHCPTRQRSRRASPWRHPMRPQRRPTLQRSPTPRSSRSIPHWRHPRRPARQKWPPLRQPRQRRLRRQPASPRRPRTPRGTSRDGCGSHRRRSSIDPRCPAGPRPAWRH